MNKAQRVTWKTSDPVSGTVVSYTNDGTANTGFVSEQTEPLGQSVAVTDPEPPNEPSTYEQHLFFASDPEWQCEAVGLGAYGSLFKDRPEHCQRKALYAAGAYLPWEGEVTNVLKISKRLQVTRLPEILFGGASGHEIMRRTLSITNKFASGGPSSGDDGGWSQTGEHEWEVTAYEPFPSDIELSLDPKNAGGTPFLFGDHEEFKKAVNAADRLLEGLEGKDSACAKLFYNIKAARKALELFAADADFKPLPKNEVGIGQSGSTVDFYEDENGRFQKLGTTSAKSVFRIFSSVIVNTSGPFLDPRNKTRIGGYPAVSKESRLLQLLHEVGHLVYGEKGATILVNDGKGTDSSLSPANTKKVKDACEAEIEAMSKEKWQ